MKAALLAAFALSSAGCALFVNGSHAELQILSEPPGASFEIRNGDGELVSKGETPGLARLQRRGPPTYDLVVTKPGYLQKRTRLATHLDNIAIVDWVLLVPILIDLPAGACWKIADPGVQVLAPDVPFQKP